MPAPRTILTALTVAGLALIPAGAQAQQTKESVKADVAAWGQSISQAFTPGYWEGEMKELDATGKVISSETKPDCIKDGDPGKLGSSLGEMFAMMADVADCTTISGGPGSLDLKLACQAPGNKQMTLVSSGTHSDGLVNWNIDFKADGDGAPESRMMQVSARRTSITCS